MRKESEKEESREGKIRIERNARDSSLQSLNQNNEVNVTATWVETNEGMRKKIMVQLGDEGNRTKDKEAYDLQSYKTIHQ